MQTPARPDSGPTIEELGPPTAVDRSAVGTTTAVNAALASRGVGRGADASRPAGGDAPPTPHSDARVVDAAAAEVFGPGTRVAQLASSDGRAVAAAEVLAGFFARYEGTTLRTYRSKLAVFSRWLGVPVAGVPAALLARGATEAHLTVIAYRAWLRDERRLAPSTINGHLAAVHAVVEFLREAGLCDWTLRVRYEKARGYRDTRGPGVPALRRLAAAAAESPSPSKRARDLALVRLLVDLGLRRGELVGLDVGHVEADADGRPTAVRVRGKGHADRERLTLPPKTSAALAAWLPLHPALASRLGASARVEAAGGEQEAPPITSPITTPGTERAAAHELLGALRAAPDAPLFTALDPGAGRPGRGGHARPAGARLGGLAVAKLLAALARRAGLDGTVRPHGIRHSAITALLDAGLGIRDVQRFSRHADVRTLAVYDDNRTDIGGTLAVKISDLV